MSDEPDDGAVEPERETPAWLSQLADARWVDQTFEEMTARQEFIDKVSCGTSEFNAGIEVGWTPAKIRTMTADPDFRELVTFARELADGNVEGTLYRLARIKGNMAAIQMWLFNRRPDRWKDVKRIEVHTDATVHIGVVHSVKAAALQLLGERSVADLQRLAIETTASDDDA